MPVYEYTCEACGRPTEAMQKISDPPLTVCPSCGKPKLKRQISLSSFQLKGTGWYATDYGGKNGADGKNGDGKAAEAPAATGEGASKEAKKEAAPEKAAPAPPSTSSSTD